MNKIKKITKYQLFLPIFCMLLVLCINIIHDIAVGGFSNGLDFFKITMTNGLMGGRIINILSRGSEIAILAVGMTLVVSASAGTDISVGSVMSLCASVCCVLLAGKAAPQATELAVPLIVAVLAAMGVGCLCGMFNGALVAHLGIQPMVATLILWTAARAIGLLVCNDLIVYVRNEQFQALGNYIGFFPTPIIIAAVCITVVALFLKLTALGTYIQSVGINKAASRITGLNSKLIIFLCYVICGLCAAIAGVVAAGRISSADSNNIGLNYELDAILAVALGGNSLGGGKFNLAGSVIGAFTIQAITTTMYNLGVSSAVTPVFKAVVVIVIVAIQSPAVKQAFAKINARRASGKEVERA